MVERKPDTLKALSCVRMNSISVSDIHSMFNYACIEHRKDAQDLLRCILCIKEGREFVTLVKSTEKINVSGIIKFSLEHIYCFRCKIGFIC